MHEQGIAFSTVVPPQLAAAARRGRQPSSPHLGGIYGILSFFIITLYQASGTAYRHRRLSEFPKPTEIEFSEDLRLESNFYVIVRVTCYAV